MLRRAPFWTNVELVDSNQLEPSSQPFYEQAIIVLCAAISMERGQYMQYEMKIESNYAPFQGNPEHEIS